MREEFCIAAFRSRQQVMAFERDLRQHGVRASVMITPRAVAMDEESGQSDGLL